MDVQILCLLRVADTSKLIKDGRPKAVLAESDGHESKPSAIVMTKAVLA